MSGTRQGKRWISTVRGCRTIYELVLGLLFASAMVGTPSAQAQTFSVLYSFRGGANGSQPEGVPFRDGQGNIYGTTASGGSGHGVVFFRLGSTRQEGVLYTFTGGADGGTPLAGLVRDTAGSFYGTTYSGGASGDGVVFKLGSVETVLHSFAGADGSHPAASLVRDSAGNLYGTTFYGGTASCGCGTVFKLDTAGTETVRRSSTPSRLTT
jgi:uncharacterized repeat protein (TIGR03803 family)